MAASALLAFSSIAACVGGIPEGDAKDASGAKGEAAPAKVAEKAPEKSKNGPEEAKAKPRAEVVAAPRKRDGAPLKTALLVSEIHCPNGVLEDPHRGFVRCLGIGEKGAKWLPPAPQTAAVSAPAPGTVSAPGTVPASVPAASAATTAAAPFLVPSPPASAAPTAPEPPAVSAPASTAPPVVEIKALVFENGDVPRAEKILGKLTEDIGKCVVKNGGLGRPSGSMKIQFIVRAKGRAEGVEVLSSQNVSAEASACIRLLLKNRQMGAPSVDPVGVTVVLNLKASSK